MTSGPPPEPQSATRPGRPLAWLLGAWAAWRLGAFAAPHVGVWAGIGAAAVGAGLAALLLRREDLRTCLRPRRGAVAAGVAAGLVMIAATYLLYGPAREALPPIGPGTELLYRRFHDAPLALIALLLPACVLSEELVWRGLVQPDLEPRLGRWGAAVVTGLAYGSAHFGAGLPLLPFLAAACGLYWGLLRAATGGLAAPLIAHVLWDVTVLLVWPLAPTGR